MTFYLSRYVRDEVSMEHFIEGLQEYLKHAIKDPQNNVSELDKSIEAMLSNKIYSVMRPALGLMYQFPPKAAEILTNPYLIHLLFYSRIFQRKHEWLMCYLSVMCFIFVFIFNHIY